MILLYFLSPVPSFYTDNDMFLENVVCFELHVYAHDSCGAQYKEAAGVHSYRFRFFKYCRGGTDTN